MKNYEVTIGYKAVIQVNLKAVDEEDARDKAVIELLKEQKKWFRNKGSKCTLADDNIKAAGCINQDLSWNTLYND